MAGSKMRHYSKISFCSNRSLPSKEPQHKRFITASNILCEPQIETSNSRNYCLNCIGPFREQSESGAQLFHAIKVYESLPFSMS